MFGIFDFCVRFYASLEVIDLLVTMTFPSTDCVSGSRLRHAFRGNYFFELALTLEDAENAPIFNQNRSSFHLYLSPISLKSLIICSCG